MAWFVLATIPTSNVLVVINALFYDHWFLLPGVGLAMTAAAALEWASTGPRRCRWAAAGAMLALLLAAAAATQHANRIWRTPISLYRHILAYEPDSAKIRNNLGMAYADAGDLSPAIAEYQRAIALSDEFPQTHHNLANAYLKTGELDQAEEEFARAVALDPRFFHSWLQLGAIALRAGRLDEAARAFEQARRAYPYAAQSYLGLASVAHSRGDPAARRDALEAGLQMLPGHPELVAAVRQLQSRPARGSLTGRDPGEAASRGADPSR